MIWPAGRAVSCCYCDNTGIVLSTTEEEIVLHLLSCISFSSCSMLTFSCVCGSLCQDRMYLNLFWNCRIYQWPLFVNVRGNVFWFLFFFFFFLKLLLGVNLKLNQYQVLHSFVLVWLHVYIYIYISVAMALIQLIYAVRTWKQHQPQQQQQQQQQPPCWQNTHPKYVLTCKVLPLIRVDVLCTFGLLPLSLTSNLSFFQYLSCYLPHPEMEEERSMKCPLL